MDQPGIGNKKFNNNNNNNKNNNNSVFNKKIEFSD